MIAPKLRKPLDPRAYRPRRKPVSIGVAFVYDQGIVFCADTKISAAVKGNESKIRFHLSKDSLCAMTFGMAGTDSIFLKAAVEACWERVKKMDFSTATMETVKNTAEFALAEFYRDHIYTHPDRAPGQLYFELLVGVWLQGKTRLFLLHETVLEPVDSYACIGAGSYLAKYLVQQYMRANPGPILLEDATLMASFMVESAIDYDETCGGEPDILIVRNDGDVNNAYSTVIYPNRMIGDLQQEMWKLLHDLAHAGQGNLREESASALDHYFKQIVKLNDSYGYTFDRKRWLANKKD
jgi:20S proteasome alpha/beta subunit